MREAGKTPEGAQAQRRRGEPTPDPSAARTGAPVSKWGLWFRRLPGKVRRTLGSYIGFAVFLVLWQLIAGVWLPGRDASAATLLPPPLAVVRAGWEMLLDGSLIDNTLASVKRVLLGFLVASSIAVPLGIAMGWWKSVYRQLDPIVEFFRPVPPLAWIPLSILWFGIGDRQNEFIIFLGVFFPVLINTMAAVRGIEPVLIRAGLSLGATPLKLLRRVVVPGSLPGILTGLRVGLGIGWMALVAAELVAARSGLGFLINDSRFIFRTDRILLGMAVIGILGLLMDRGLRRLSDRLLPWYAGR